MKRIVILISGRGSNMVAVVDAVRAGRIDGEVVRVISNRPEAAGLALARDAGVSTAVVDHRGFAQRESFDRALQDEIDAAAPDLVVLAGFMRILGASFIEHYQGRMINIHPSLLPAYPGLDTHARVLAAGTRIHGCSVHFVTLAVDHGPVIAQAAVGVRDDDDPARLAARVLAVEHPLLAAVVGWFCAGRIRMESGRARVVDVDAGAQALFVPAEAACHAFEPRVDADAERCT